MWTILCRIFLYVNWNLIIPYLRVRLCTASTFVKYVRCLGDNVYQDTSSLAQIFYKEVYILVLHSFTPCKLCIKIANSVLCKIV